ncbi:hypothetical protein [Burkholderia ubonensis]|uniref:hypothetical protein n=1 Tax=Burkholderia ubonensis TaxID=101571 RepID=UPI0015CAEC32|nr:hypothetical protein [Burkholderia ubonensis]
MNIRDNAPPRFPAMVPEIAKPTPVNFDNAGSQRVWIDVVVEDELFDRPRLAVGT